jgi:hypothetical protein
LDNYEFGIMRLPSITEIPLSILSILCTQKKRYARYWLSIIAANYMEETEGVLKAQGLGTNCPSRPGAVGSAEKMPGAGENADEDRELLAALDPSIGAAPIVASKLKFEIVLTPVDWGCTNCGE